MQPKHLRRAWQLAGLAAVGLTILALFPRQPVESPPAASSAQPAPVRFGPGVWTGGAPVPELPVVGQVWDTEPPAGPNLDRDGSLRIDQALRDVIDHFLLGGHPGTRADHLAALRLHLEARLPPTAFARSWQIVEQYVLYLEEHDRLLAREPMPAIHMNGAAQPLDVDRIHAWVSQRARLRQTILGMQVAQAWFGEEERELEQMLLALRSGQGGIAAQVRNKDPLDDAASTLRELHAQAASTEARRELIAARFGEDAGRRYEMLEHEEQAWQAQFESYRQQAQAVRRRPGLSEEDRAREIDALLAHFFPDEAQRLRATALDR